MRPPGHFNVIQIDSDVLPVVPAASAAVKQLGRNIYGRRNRVVNFKTTCQPGFIVAGGIITIDLGGVYTQCN